MAEAILIYLQNLDFMGCLVIILGMEFNSEKTIEGVAIYSDGAADPNPGPGGYGVVLLCKGRRKELSEGFKCTTNNRMELLGVIAGLEALKMKCSGTVYSDSKYVVDAVNLGWVYNWQKKGWRRKKSGKAKNSDLWQRFLDVYKKHDMVLKWVKGHAGIEENEVCDQLAGAAAKGNDLPEDTGYIKEEKDVSIAHEPTKLTGSWSKAKKITHKEEGEPCRKCGTPIKKRVPRKKKIKSHQTYYFQWHLFCPGCDTTYMVEEAKRIVEKDGLPGEEIDNCGTLF